MAEIVYVTRAEQIAATALIESAQQTGKPVRPVLRVIAEPWREDEVTDEMLAGDDPIAVLKPRTGPLRFAQRANA